MSHQRTDAQVAASVRSGMSVEKQLHAVIDVLPDDARAALIARASKPSIRYQRYRKNGLTRVRKARAPA